MNISSSECSSGCESGWTMYLDQSANSADQFQKAGGIIVGGEDCSYNKAAAANVEDHEDLSMVSDASSGPPHNFLEDDEEDDCCDGTGYFLYGSAAGDKQANKSKNKKKIGEQRGKQLHSYLDDTASSHSKKHAVLPPSGTPMENTLGLSQGLSSKHFKGKSTMQKHLGFFQSSMSGNQSSRPAGSLQGRKWE